MKLATIIFVLVAYNCFSVLYAQSDETVTVSFPEFQEPEQHIGTVSGSNVLADVLMLIAQGVVWVAELLFGLVKYILELVVFVAKLSFHGVDGAPWWVSLLISVPYIAGVAIILIRIARKGDAAT